MSREIDLTQKLSDEDKEYLMTRGREYDVVQNEVLMNDPQEAVATGDISSVPEVANPSGLQQIQPLGAADPEALTTPYDREGVTKEMLVAEIRRRNALPENDEYEDIPTRGSKDSLAAALTEDDDATAGVPE